MKVHSNLLNKDSKDSSNPKVESLQSMCFWANASKVDLNIVSTQKGNYYYYGKYYQSNWSGYLFLSDNW